MIVAARHVRGARHARRWAALLVALLAGCSAEPGSGGDNAVVTIAPSSAPVVPAATPAPTPDPRPTPTKASLPAEVTAFTAKRDRCDQLREEEPYDDARAAELDRALAATCTGTDAALATLRTRYAGDARTTAALAKYDGNIE